MNSKLTTAKCYKISWEKHRKINPTVYKFTTRLMHVMILFLFRTRLWKKVHRYFIQTKEKTCLVVVPDFEFIFKNVNVVRPLLNLLPTGITARRLGILANVFCGSHLEPSNPSLRKTLGSTTLSYESIILATMSQHY